MSTTAGQALPDFARPPVVEVAVGVEFVPVPDFRLAQMLRFQSDIRSEFPKIQEQPPLPPSAEPDGVLVAGLGLQIASGPQPIRLWLLSDDEHWLIQLQLDRMILNWRRLDEKTKYPRYQVMRPRFMELWRKLRACMSGLSTFRPTVAEVTFVNSIDSVDGRADLSHIMSVAKSPSGLPGELVHSSANYVVRLGNGSRPAQLIANVGPNGSNDGQVSLTVSTRVGLNGEETSEEDVGGALDFAHNSGVVGFDRLTNESMHRVWGRGE